MGTLSIIDSTSTISGNEAGGGGGEGGGLFNGGTGVLKLLNVTITNNLAPTGRGGGISNRKPGPASLRNTIVAQNLNGDDCATIVNSMPAVRLHP